MILSLVRRFHIIPNNLTNQFVPLSLELSGSRFEARVVKHNLTPVIGFSLAQCLANQSPQSTRTWKAATEADDLVAQVNKLYKSSLPCKQNLGKLILKS